MYIKVSDYYNKLKRHNWYWGLSTKKQDIAEGKENEKILRYFSLLSKEHNNLYKWFKKTQMDRIRNIDKLF